MLLPYAGYFIVVHVVSSSFTFKPPIGQYRAYKKFGFDVNSWGIQKVMVAQFLTEFRAFSDLILHCLVFCLAWLVALFFNALRASRYLCFREVVWFVHRFMVGSALLIGNWWQANVPAFTSLSFRPVMCLRALVSELRREAWGWIGRVSIAGSVILIIGHLILQAKWLYLPRMGYDKDQVVNFGRGQYL